MIYLDTNVLLWLAAGEHKLISGTVLDIVDSAAALSVSPMVVLELEYLKETTRITADPSDIIKALQEQIGLVICEKKFTDVINAATKLSWTRDPFDRLITAQASVANNVLLTSDRVIQEHYQHAVW